MSKSFSTVVYKFNNLSLAFQLIYFLSKKIKNIEDYWKYRNEKIDFSYSRYIKIIEKIKNQNIPIEREFNKIFFYKNFFHIYKKVFLPREETNQIINITKKLIQKYNFKNLSYIDLCSGCGAIGISIFLENKKYILNTNLLDISKIAVKNIKKNIKKFNIKAQIILGDWKNEINKNKYSLITANFPYIDKKDFFDKEIIANNPKKSLFANKHGWDHYEKILKFVNLNIHWKLIILECNEFHENLWKENVKKIKNKTISFEFHYDFLNKFRFISITKLA